MPPGNKPLYGRIEFGKEIDLSTLIERLEEISDRFLGQRPFSAYLRVASGQSYYGLNYEELTQSYAQHEGKVTTLSASATSPEGKGFNIVMNFTPGSREALGRYMIAAGGMEENLEIRDLLLGVWEPKPPRAPSPEEVPLTQDPLPADSPKQQEEPGSLPILEDSFYFDPEMPVNTLIDRLYDLFIQFLDDATFEVRLWTFTSQETLSIQVDHLRNTLRRLRGKVRRMHVELQSPQGQALAISFSYEPFSSVPDSTFRLQTSQNEEIQSFIRSHFAISSGKGKRSVGDQSSSKMFAFNPKQLECKKLSALVTDLMEEWFAPAHLQITLLNRKGLLHTFFLPEDLCKSWGREKEGPSLINIHLSRPITGQILHLMLDFDQGRGSLYQMTGGPAIQATILESLFSLLPLQEWKGKSLLSAAPQAPGLMLNSDAWMADPVPDSGLVLLPHQDGLADEIWYELQKAMQEAGYSCYRAESLFGYMVTDKLWSLMMRAEVVIADLSDLSAEVFYLLGMAHALGKRTLLLAREAGDVPFDFKKYPHILYQPSDTGFQQLRKQLITFLQSESDASQTISS